MAAMSITSGLFFSLSLILALRERSFKWRQIVLPSAYCRAAFAMIAVALVSMAVAWLDPPLGIRATSFGEVKKFLYFVLPMLCAWALMRLSALNGRCLEEQSFWPVFWGMSAFVSILAVFQFWAVPLFGPEIQPYFGRFLRLIPSSLHAHGQGLMFFHLSFASVLSFSFCYALAKALWIEDSSARGALSARVAWFCLAALFALAVFYSYSRISWLGLGVAFVLLVLLRKPIWGLSALAVTLLLATFIWFTSDAVRERFNDPLGWGDRARLMRNAWLMFQDRPITGVGFAKTGFYADRYAEKLFGVNNVIGSHAHNNFLDVLATTGVLGGAAFLFWVICLQYYAWQEYRRSQNSDRWLPAALFVAGIVFQVNGLTQVNFYDAKSQHALVFWAGLVLALHWRRDWLTTEESQKP